MKIEIPGFLIEMSKQMNEQDNRCTAEPVWQVRCRRSRVTAEGYSDTFELVDHENDYDVVATNKENDNINEQILEWFGADDDNLPEMIEKWVDAEEELETVSEKLDYFVDNFDCHYDSLGSLSLLWVEEYEDIVKGAFLTEADANWFIQRKQHDYPKLYTYVESMTYCPQMIELRNWIKSIDDDEKARIGSQTNPLTPEELAELPF